MSHFLENREHLLLFFISAFLFSVWVACRIQANVPKASVNPLGAGEQQQGLATAILLLTSAISIMPWVGTGKNTERKQPCPPR